jgi:DNA-binding transcriptional LysR family regulator
MIMFPRAIAPALFDEILGFCRAAGFTLRIAQEARQTQTIISLVSAGLGIAIVPASIRHLKRKGVVYRSFKEETPLVRVIAVWSCDQSSVAIKNFVNMTQIAAAA